MARPMVTTLVASASVRSTAWPRRGCCSAGELDAHEVLEVDLLHRVEVLQPGRDVVDGRLDAVPLQRLVGRIEQRTEVVEQQLAQEHLALDRLLLRLDVLVQPPELHVVSGQQRATFAELPLDHGDLLRDRLVAQCDLLERADHGVVTHEGEHPDGSAPEAALLQLGVDAVERARGGPPAPARCPCSLPPRRGTSPGVS